MLDPLGAIITYLRDDADVTAIVGSKVRGEVLSGETPPLVVIAENTTTRRPYGPGSGRLGLQGGTYVARCYGPDNQTGAITARQLAGAVSDALHGVRPRNIGGKYLAISYAPELTGAIRDPDLRWPMVAVRIDVTSAAEAAA